MNELLRYAVENRAQLHGFAFSRLRHHQDVEDVLATVDRRLTNTSSARIDELRATGIRPYVFTAVRNACVDVVRERKRRFEVQKAIERDDLGKNENGGMSADMLERAMAALADCLDKLFEAKRRQAEVVRNFWAFYLKNEIEPTPEELAAAMKISANGAKSLLCLARAVLRLCMTRKGLGQILNKSK